MILKLLLCKRNFGRCAADRQVHVSFQAYAAEGNVCVLCYVLFSFNQKVVVCLMWFSEKRFFSSLLLGFMGK